MKIEAAAARPGQLEARLDGAGVTGLLGRLGGEGADGPDGRERFLRGVAGVGEGVLVFLRKGPDLPAVEDRADGHRRNDEQHDRGELGRRDDEQHEPAHDLDGVSQRHRELGREQPLERGGVRRQPRGEVAGPLPVEEGHLLHDQRVEELLAHPFHSPFTGQGEEVGPATHGEPLHDRQRAHEECGEADPADVPGLERAVDDDADALRVGEGGRRADQQQGGGAGEGPPLHPEQRQDVAGGGEAVLAGHGPVEANPRNTRCKGLMG
jgi:hypothetical protein